MRVYHPRRGHDRDTATRIHARVLGTDFSRTDKGGADPPPFFFRTPDLLLPNPVVIASIDSRRTFLRQDRLFSIYTRAKDHSLRFSVKFLLSAGHSP